MKKQKFSPERPDRLADKSIFTETMVEMSWIDVKKEAQHGSF
ncbi:MAG: hypothetical protein QME66_01065 [Candidatus Eisenbacteria bacterium]|nr:hypothetical protein [Candidatus Eisenbacteria bacterium]